MSDPNTDYYTNQGRDTSVVFHRHRRIMHAAGGLTYYAGRNGDFTARQVTPVEQDVSPDWQADVYVTVYPLRVLSGKRGGNRDIAGAGGVFAEFDAKDFVTEAEAQPYYVAPEKPTDRAITDAWATARKHKLVSSAPFFSEVMARVDAHIAALRVQPSTIVNSGGGRHCYWYFDKPVVFKNDDDRHRYAAFLEAWIAYVGGDPGAKDLARVLRVPGSVNAKPPYVALFGAPLAVTFVSFNPDRRYAFDALVQMLPATWAAPAVERKVRQNRQYTGGKPTPTQAGDLPDLPEVRRFNATHRIDDELRRAGCTRAHGNRWITPQSTSGQSSLAVNREANHAWAFSPKNPVGRDGKIRPADLALQSDFDGNVEAFLDSLRTDDAIDFARLYQFATFGDIEPMLRTRLNVIAERLRQQADQAAAHYAENPTDQTETHAVKMAKKADQAAARVNAHAGTDPTRRRLMIALLDKFRETGTDQVYCSTLKLAARANMSRHTVITTLDELEDWFVVTEKAEKRAALFRLSPLLRKVPVFAHDQTPFVQSCAKTGTLALHTHYDHDAMCAVMTPRPDTEEERMKVAETANAIRHGLNVAPKDDEAIRAELPAVQRDLVRDPLPDTEKNRRRLAAAYLYTQQSRFAATLPSLGGRALMLLTHLQAMGGTTALSALAGSLGVKANRLSELVAKLETIGLVTKPDHYTISLVVDWADVLDEKVKEMPTFGSKAIRTVDWINAAIVYQEHRMNEAFTVANENPDLVETMTRRINAIQRTIDDLEARRSDLEAWANDLLPAHKLQRIMRRPATSEERERIEQQRRLSRAAVLAAKDEATEAAKQAAKCLAQGMAGDQVERALVQAGFTPNAIAHGIRYAHRYADSLTDTPRPTVWRDGAWVEVPA